jgi:hypothetical protein
MIISTPNLRKLSRGKNHVKSNVTKILNIIISSLIHSYGEEALKKDVAILRQGSN